MAKKFKVVFYAKTSFPTAPNWTYQFTYRGDNLAEAVVKGMRYAGKHAISSFTILRGEETKRNVKFNDYIKSIYG